jgi:hypothetical protein
MLRKLLYALFSLLFIKVQSQQTVIPSTQKIGLSHSFIFAELPEDWHPSLINTQSTHAPSGWYAEAKKEVDAKRSNHIQLYTANKTEAFDGPSPKILSGIDGLGTDGTPNDNGIAVSNNGHIISVSNSRVRIFNDSARLIYDKSLSWFATKSTKLTRAYDPKVIYDPNADRFIVVFLNGVLSGDNQIVVCFSKTNDPLGAWNTYKLPGNNEKDTTWSDYPIISITKEDFFVTVNKLKDNQSWKTGFVKSIVWQVRMKEAYLGDSLVSNYFNQVKYNGKPVWSICPIQGGIRPTHPFAYLMSVRPGDIKNDTVFIHYIDNTVGSGAAKLTTQMVKTDLAYGIPPSAPQPGGKQVLETNDTRVLSGIWENGVIQYCQTTVDTHTYRSAVYHGVVSQLSTNPTIKGSIIGIDTLDIAYPSICYAGAGTSDNGALITFSFVNDKTFPGTAAVYAKRNLDGYSPLVICKNGENIIDVLADTAERWGDYTSVCRKYNSAGECWLNGSWGTVNKQSYTWIAQLKNGDPQLATNSLAKAAPSSVLYPNPVNENMSVTFELTETTPLSFTIYNVQGKQMLPAYFDRAKSGTNSFSFQVTTLPVGNYILKIESANGNTQLNKPFVVVR